MLVKCWKILLSFPLFHLFEYVSWQKLTRITKLCAFETCIRELMGKKVSFEIHGVENHSRSSDMIAFNWCLRIFFLHHSLDYSVCVCVSEFICMCRFRWIKVSFRNTHFNVLTDFNHLNIAKPFYSMFWSNTKRLPLQMKLVVIWKFVLHNSYN